MQEQVKNNQLPELKVGDKVEILYHLKNEFTGRQGKVMFIGAGLKQGTNPLEANIHVPDPEQRFIVILDDNSVVNDVRYGQLKKI
jgi:hypothetical protein